MFDYLIKNATLVDGLGGQPVTGHLAIKEGLIVGVGEVDGQPRKPLTPTVPTRAQAGLMSTRTTMARSAGMT